MPVVQEKRESGGVCEGNSTTRGPPMRSDPGTTSVERPWGKPCYGRIIPVLRRPILLRGLCRFPLAMKAYRVMPPLSRRTPARATAHSMDIPCRARNRKFRSCRLQRRHGCCTHPPPVPIWFVGMFAWLPPTCQARESSLGASAAPPTRLRFRMRP